MSAVLRPVLLSGGMGTRWGPVSRHGFPNESVYIPIGAKHRLANLGRVDLPLIEVQSGDDLGEDDIVRLDDPYGR